MTVAGGWKSEGQYVATERLFLDLSVQFPLASDVGSEGLASDWNALASFRFAF